MMSILFIVEGETEKALLQALNLPGKIKIHNLWEINIAKHTPNFRADTIIVIYDSDKTENSQRFIENIGILQRLNKRNGKRITLKLLQQTFNLEDELIFSCGNKPLSHFFGTSSKSEFKTKLIACTNLDKKLQEWGFDTQKLWNREIINQLSTLKKYQCTFKDLKK